MSTTPRRGWRDRGRLPHADFAGLSQAITFRLADALPAVVLDRIHRQASHSGSAGDARIQAQQRERLQDWLDEGHGSCLLHHAVACTAIQEALHAHDGAWYRLHGYVVMPNHVHVLATMRGVPLGTVVRAWKGPSARIIHAALGGDGVLWQREYHDRFIRDERHFAAAVAYLIANPVRARLVDDGRRWPGLWLAPGTAG